MSILQLSIENSIRRISVLKLLNSLLEFAPSQSVIIAEAFCELQRNQSDREFQKRQLMHYTDGIEGCGYLLETQIKEHFFKALEKIL